MKIHIFHYKIHGYKGPLHKLEAKGNKSLVPVPIFVSA
jgi:hypothetical protein